MPSDINWHLKEIKNVHASESARPQARFYSSFICCYLFYFSFLYFRGTMSPICPLENALLRGHLRDNVLTMSLFYGNVIGIFPKCHLILLDSDWKNPIIYWLLTRAGRNAILPLWINKLNRWCGDKGSYDFTESPRCWESSKKQTVKWTAEGAVKCENLAEYSATYGIR